MIRTVTALAVSAFALISVSCCCTGEPEAPPLRPLPHYQEIQTTQSQEVIYTK